MMQQQPSNTNPLVGKAVINQRGNSINTNDILLNCKLIAFFFNGAWCQKSSSVIPILIDIYEEGLRRETGLEIFYVPCGTNLTDMVDDYGKQGNWYSVLYGDVLGEELRWMYNITYVPSIIVITKEGRIISKKGVEEVVNHGLNVLVIWVGVEFKDFFNTNGSVSFQEENIKICNM